MEQIRKTKIICTMGPSTEKEGVLEKLMLAGMNVARFTFHMEIMKNNWDA